MRLVVSIIDNPIDRLQKGLDERALAALLAHLAEKTAEKWRDLAKAQLTSSRNEYVAGVQNPVPDGEAVVIELRGQLPNMVEHGASAFQLQQVMLDDAESKVIPFRFQTPGTRGSLAPTLGSAYGADGPNSRRRPHTIVGDPMALGRQVHKAAKALGPGKALPPGTVPRLREEHTTDLYAGLQRMGAANHTQYRTFRTITRGSEPKWLHPGITARRLHKGAQAHLAKIATASARAYLAGALTGRKGRQ